MMDAIFIISYILSCCFYFKDFPEETNPVFKLIPILLLLINTLYKSGFSTRFSILFIALLFSLLGDFFLLFPSKFFLYGIAAFLTTQILYTYLFGIDFSYAYSLICFTAFSAALFAIILYPKLPNNATLQISVVIYCILITLMLWAATALMQRQKFNLSGILGFIGAVLFYISDFSLAINKWVSPFYYSQLVIMFTYYSAQLLISYAIFNAE